jgi:hypothetical protein
MNKLREYSEVYWANSFKQCTFKKFRYQSQLTLTVTVTLIVTVTVTPAHFDRHSDIDRDRDGSCDRDCDRDLECNVKLYKYVNACMLRPVHNTQWTGKTP